MNITEHLNYIRDFTKVYRSGKSLGKELLEAECLNIQYPFMLAPLKHGDLLAGRFEYPLVYFLPQTYSRRDGEGFGYIFDHSVFDELLKNGISENEKEELKQYKEFWESENTVALMKNSYSKEIRNALPSDNWTKESGVAFPLYRMAGSVMNYDFLLKHGVSGIKEIVEEKYNNSSKNKKSFYFAVLKALDIFCNSCQYYIDICSEMIKTENDPEYKNHLQNLESALIEIKDNKPSSLLAAMQMMMIYNTISGSLNFGRIDEYLGDFLCEDLINNRIDEGIALNYIIGLWKLIIARNTAFDGRVIIGGKGRRNEKNADRFALLAMEATRRTNDVLPQLMLRLYDGKNEELLIKAMEVLNSGNTFPML